MLLLLNGSKNRESLITKLTTKKSSNEDKPTNEDKPKRRRQEEKPRSRDEAKPKAEANHNRLKVSEKENVIQPKLS